MFIGCLLQFYKNKLEYDNLKTMDEVIRRNIVLVGNQTMK